MRKRLWPSTVEILLRSEPSGEEFIVYQGKGEGNVFEPVQVEGRTVKKRAVSPDSPLGQAIRAWFEAPSLYVIPKVRGRDSVKYKLVAFKAQDGEWVSNSPDLWQSLTYVGVLETIRNPQEAKERTAQILQLLKELDETRIDPSTGSEVHRDFAYLSKRVVQIALEERGLEEAKSLFKWRTSYPPSGPWWFASASKAIALLRSPSNKDSVTTDITRIKDAARLAQIVLAELQTREAGQNLPGVLRACSAALADFWDLTGDDRYLFQAKSLAEESLKWEKSFLKEVEPQSSSRTGEVVKSLCLLARIYWSLEENNKADECLRQAEEYGRPCQSIVGKKRRLLSERIDVHK